MASGRSDRNRIYFLCPHCKKAQRALPGHLRKSCMRNSTEAEILATVKQAKKDMREFTHKGRFWEYQQIEDIFGAANPLAKFIEVMQRKGLVVRNIPPAFPAPTLPVPALYIPQRARESVNEPEVAPVPVPVPEPEPEPSEDSSGEYYQSTVGPKWTTDVRVEMTRKGLYKKHSIDHPLLAGFHRYLHVTLGNKRGKQEVEGVSRFMYYMDSSAPNLNFVRQVEKVREYFNLLGQTKCSQQTVLNYWKGLKRFMKYIVTSTDIRTNDPTLYNDCKSFMDPLNGIQAGMLKNVSKELTQKRYHGYGKDMQPEDCVAILDVAHSDFIGVMGKLQDPAAISGEALTTNDCLLVLYYLEAIVMLKLLQRPGVVTNMTVEEWEARVRRKNGSSIAVKEHKTAASQLAEVPLTDDLEHWFGLYFKHIRPVMLQGKRSRGDMTAEGRFFVSSTGRPIYNPCNDLKRLHDKYKIAKVTSGDARTAFETAAKTLPELERNAVASLLGKTPETAKKHYWMKTPGDAFLATNVVNRLAGITQSGFGGSPRQQPKVDESTAFNVLIQSCPVTLDGAPPKKKSRQELCGVHERHCYDRWRGEQLKLREQHVIDHFALRQPSSSRVDAWMEKQGWTSNVPQASLIIKQWKPCGTVDSALDSSSLRKMVDTQHWKGLTVQDVPRKGRGVFTKRPFKQGEVVCDYHGQQVSRKEGMDIYATIADMRPGNMFFYKNKSDVGMCIDAHEDSCQCHPLTTTFGRLINHSSKRANVRPRLVVHNNADIILFISLKDIGVNEELLFDYGTQRKSYAGEELDLNWT